MGMVYELNDYVERYNAGLKLVNRLVPVLLRRFIESDDWRTEARLAVEELEDTKSIETLDDIFWKQYARFYTKEQKPAYFIQQLIPILLKNFCQPGSLPNLDASFSVDELAENMRKNPRQYWYVYKPKNKSKRELVSC